MGIHECRDPLNEMTVPNNIRSDIHRHPQTGSCPTLAVPINELREGLVEDQTGDLIDQPVRLRQWDEVERRHEGSIFHTSPSQSLHTDNPLGGQFQDRLVLNVNIVTLERSCQRPNELAPSAARFTGGIVIRGMAHGI